MARSAPIKFFEEHRDVYVLAKDIILRRYPIVFNYEFPLPVAIGTHHALCYDMAYTLKDGEIDVFFQFWTNKTIYLEALVITKHRYDLQGNRVAEASPGDIAWAEHRLKYRTPVLRAL